MEAPVPEEGHFAKPGQEEPVSPDIFEEKEPEEETEPISLVKEEPETGEIAEKPEAVPELFPEEKEKPQLFAEPENAEDIFQEVFIKFSEKTPKFKSEEHEKAWLIKVTINCSKNLLNSNFLKYNSELKEEITFETKERHDIYYAVHELPLKYRTIIHLYYYEQYKINEISKILNINENTIKSRLSRAREKLKQKIEGGIE